MKPFLCLGALVFFCSFKASSQDIIAAKDADKNIGKTVTITEKVYGGRLLVPSNATILNLGGNEPGQLLIVMIPANDKDKFKGKPEDDYKGKDITVTGTLRRYHGKPAIMVNDPTQLKVVLIDHPKRKHRAHH